MGPSLELNKLSWSLGCGTGRLLGMSAWSNCWCKRNGRVLLRLASQLSTHSTGTAMAVGAASLALRKQVTRSLSPHVTPPPPATPGGWNPQTFESNNNVLPVSNIKCPLSWTRSSLLMQTVILMNAGQSLTVISMTLYNWLRCTGHLVVKKLTICTLFVQAPNPSEVQIQVWNKISISYQIYLDLWSKIKFYWSENKIKTLDIFGYLELKN